MTLPGPLYLQAPLPSPPSSVFFPTNKVEASTKQPAWFHNQGALRQPILVHFFFLKVIITYKGIYTWHPRKLCFLFSLRLIPTRACGARRPQTAPHKQTLLPAAFPSSTKRGAAGWSTISVQIHKHNCSSCIPPAQHEGQDLHMQLLIHSFLLQKMTTAGLGFGFALPMASTACSVFPTATFLLLHCPSTPHQFWPHAATQSQSRTLHRHDCSHKIYAFPEDKSSYSWPKRILHTLLWTGANAISERIWIATFNQINHHCFERTASEHLRIS